MNNHFENKRKILKLSSTEFSYFLLLNELYKKSVIFEKSTMTLVLQKKRVSTQLSSQSGKWDGCQWVRLSVCSQLPRRGVTGKHTDQSELLLYRNRLPPR
jgi:hypothetical protein